MKCLESSEIYCRIPGFCMQHNSAIFFYLLYRLHFVYLGFVSPCIIIYSNKSIIQMHESLSFIANCRLNTAQHVSGGLMPTIRSLSTVVAASGLPLERGDSNVVGRGRSDYDQQHCYHHVPTLNQRRLLQFISSWWWVWGCPKHVELYLNDS
jgi:hypothetical protein